MATTQFKHQWQTSLFAAVVCFAAYTCIFSFRKAFNVAGYEGYTVGIFDYKVLLVVTQAIGYMASKFYGIRFIAEMKRYGRGRLILLLVGISWVAWLAFALVPPPYNFWVLLFNGFPLGMLWGVVFSYAEGRRATDFIGASLAVSFIFASGIAKSTGQYVMESWGTSEYWMPFITGLIFFIPLLLFVWLLEKIPAPDSRDIAHRTERLPMHAEERKRFIRFFLPGIVMLVLVYVLATILREVRDGFMADMWRESGISFNPATFTKTETLISIIILAMIASMVIIRNNLKAFLLAHLVMIGGFLLSGIVTILFLNGTTGMFTWMTLVGLGLYMAYIPYNALLFDRMIATFRYTANVGFIIYVADAFGYLANLGVILGKNIFRIELNWLGFYTQLVLWSAVIGVICTFLSMLYFRAKARGKG